MPLSFMFVSDYVMSKTDDLGKYFNELTIELSNLLSHGSYVCVKLESVITDVPICVQDNLVFPFYNE